MNRCDFSSLDYLRCGNDLQRRSYEMLEREGIFRKLAPYGPLLAGTIPICIDVEGSDLDIVCRTGDADGFALFANVKFGHYDGFSSSVHDDGVAVCRFECDGIPVEIYASDIEPSRSNAYRHMLVEERVLRLLGETFRSEVVRLKRQGMKTEPAFAVLLGMGGDPYEGMLRLETLSDTDIRIMAEKAMLMRNKQIL